MSKATDRYHRVAAENYRGETVELHRHISIKGARRDVKKHEKDERLRRGRGQQPMYKNIRVERSILSPWMAVGDWETDD